MVSHTPSGLCNISNTRKSVSSGYPNPEKWVEKTRRSRVFLTDFEVFRDLMKHSFEFLIWLLKPFIILGEIQDFMLIKIRYPNHRHGSDFLCFLSQSELVCEVTHQHYREQFIRTSSSFPKTALFSSLRSNTLTSDRYLRKPSI